MTENAEYLGLEQACIKPGHWLIEGYDVKRVKDVEPPSWNGRRRQKTTWSWRVSRPGVLVLAPQFETLTKAREWIANGGDKR